jgi:predicted transcriptional regulator of viral defense system
MKTIDLIDTLRKRPVFRRQDIERYANYDSKYAKLILNRLLHRKLIKRVWRNAYTTKDNINVIASNLIYPSYISFWSASYFLGYTEQIVNTIQIATTSNVNRIVLITFENYKIKIIPIKSFFGYKKLATNDGDIFIAEDEKLIIDAFLKPKECGNFDEIIKIIENSSITEDKLVTYLEKVNKSSISKRVGYLIEKIKEIDISKSLELDNNYIMLNPFSRKSNTINAKWRIRV